MSEEHVEHAFDRFYQGENYNAMGTGLGLSLSKELIELHGGKIHLWSKKKEGTRFEICLLLGKDHFPADQIVKLPMNTLLYDETLESCIFIPLYNFSKIL